MEPVVVAYPPGYPRQARIEDFRLENVRDRIAKVGDLWTPLLSPKGRTDLGKFV